MIPNSIREFIRRHVFSNIAAKLMALAMALALWLFGFTFSYSDPETFTVRVRPTVPPGWSVVGTPTVDVRLSYPRRLESQRDQLARSLDIKCTPPVTDTGEDAQEIIVPLRESDLQTGRFTALKVLRFSPQELRINVVRETTRSVNVIPQVSAAPPGYEVIFKHAVPSSVMLTGRKDVLSELIESGGIRTELINIADMPLVSRKPDETITYPARLPAFVTIKGVDYPIRTTDTVQVRIVLARPPGKKVFENIPVRILLPKDGAPYAYDAALFGSVRSADVTVTGPEATVNAIKPEDLVLYVDVAGLVPQSTPYQQAIHIARPDIPGAGELEMKLSTPSCGVKITERAAPR